MNAYQTAALDLRHRHRTGAMVGGERYFLLPNAHCPLPSRTQYCFRILAVGIPN